jgi:hypothetical protein
MSRNPLNQNSPDGAPFAVHTILDEQHQRMPVATFEHPVDWLARSQVVWDFQDTSCPVMVYGTAFNPHGTESFEFLPLEACFWVEPNFMYAQGQRYKGLTCLAPMGAQDALVKWAIPKYRGDRQNLHVIEALSIPNLARTLNADELQNIQSEGVRARITYVENGQTFEEDFYACCYWQAPNTGQTNWGLARLFCFRAARGQLDAMRPTLWRVYNSLQSNPQWQQLNAQINQQLADQHAAFIGGVRAKLQAEVEFGQKMTEYRQWQRDQQQQQLNASFAADERRRQQEQAAYGKYDIAEARGDLLMGRTAVEDPDNQYGNPHYDYGHHQAHWKDKNDNWIDTNDLNYDPNTDPNRDGQWVRVQERKVGE